MRWWTRRAPVFAALVVVALATGPAALAQAPGTDGPTAAGRSTTTTALPTSTDPSTTPSSNPSTTQTTTTAPPDTGGGAATTNAGQAGRGSTSTSNPPRSTTSTTTTTTTILAIASGTWITAPGYNPEWHNINPPWVLKPPSDSGFGRRIVYSKFQQRVWLIEDNGYITNTHLVSGRYDIPAFGVYQVYSKSYSTFATHNPSIVWNYMVRFAVGPQGGGIGLHEIPTQYGRPVQTVEQLGQPLSGGCVRQSHDDAVLVWNWAPIGTTVVVVP
jgi:L,D-transpeptidase catalytic domain